MILSTLYVGVALATTPAVVSRAIATKIKESEVKDKILDEGIYHFTSDECADKILESKHIKPSSMLVSYFTGRKTYFFAGPPDMHQFRTNLPSKMNPLLNEIYEYTAIKVKPDEKDLSNFKMRKFSDDVIVHDGAFHFDTILDGQCNVHEDKITKVNLVVDLDKDGKICFREKTPEEIEKGDYTPSDKLKNRLESERKQNSPLKEGLYQYKAATKRAVQRTISSFKGMFDRSSKELMLGPAKDEELDIDTSFNEDLNSKCLEETEIIEKEVNKLEIKEVKEQEKNKSDDIEL